MSFLFPATVYVGGAPRFSIPMAGHARTAQISDGAGDPTKIVISSQHGCSDSLGFPPQKESCDLGPKHHPTSGHWIPPLGPGGI